MAQEILDVSTLAPDRPTVRIRTPEKPDGELYEMRTADEIGIEPSQKIWRLGQTIQELTAEENLGKVQVAELDHALKKLARIALVECPKGVIESLGEGHRLRIAEVFLGQFPGYQAAMRGEGGAAAGQTQESSSRGSNGSTEATPSPGSG